MENGIILKLHLYTSFAQYIKIAYANLCANLIHINGDGQGTNPFLFRQQQGLPVEANVHANLLKNPTAGIGTREGIVQMAGQLISE
jgi:hypothetical protein